MTATNFGLKKTSGYESGLISKIASNSLDVGVGTLVKLASGFIDEVDAGDTIEGISDTKRVYASDNQTVASDVITYKPVRVADYYIAAGQGLSIVFAGDFVASNSITMTVNGVAMTPVVFSVDHLTTITAVAAQLSSQFASVLGTATVGGASNRTIFIPTDGIRSTVTIAGIAVTLGASQTTGVVTEYIIATDVGKFYDVTTTTQLVNGASEHASSGQLRLEKYISSSVNLYSIANT